MKEMHLLYSGTIGKRDVVITLAQKHSQSGQPRKEEDVSYNVKVQYR